MPTAHVECVEANCSNPNPDGTPGVVTITDVVLDNPGSGYSPLQVWLSWTAPSVRPNPSRWHGSGSCRYLEDPVNVDTFGAGYTSAPECGHHRCDRHGKRRDRDCNDQRRRTSQRIRTYGWRLGLHHSGGIQKFTDDAARAVHPAGLPDDRASTSRSGCRRSRTTTVVEADEYVIGLVQYRTRSRPACRRRCVRGYVQLETAANARHQPALSADQ